MSDDVLESLVVLKLLATMVKISENDVIRRMTCLLPAQVRLSPNCFINHSFPVELVCIPTVPAVSMSYLSSSSWS